jgi:hypothetical protein
VGYNSRRDATLLMIQWVIWKHLSQILIMDESKMQQLAEKLAHAFYEDGVRMPLDDDPETTPLELHTELLHIVDVLDPPLPPAVGRELVVKRARQIAQCLVKRGWRKFSDVAA